MQQRPWFCSRRGYLQAGYRVDGCTAVPATRFAARSSSGKSSSCSRIRPCGMVKVVFVQALRRMVWHTWPHIIFLCLPFRCGYFVVCGGEDLFWEPVRLPTKSSRRIPSPLADFLWLSYSSLHNIVRSTCFCRKEIPCTTLATRRPGSRCWCTRTARS